MTPELSVLIAVALYLLAGLFVLFLGGRLVQDDLDRRARKDDAAAQAGPGTNYHLGPLKDLTVDFFSRVEPCARLLTLLARHQQPLTVKAMVREAQAPAEHRDNAAAPGFAIEWASLWIMRVAGLVRPDGGRILLTRTGREVHRRITIPSDHSKGEKKRHQQSAYDALFVPLPIDNRPDSHRQRVREALQREASESGRRDRLPASFRIGELREPNQALAINGSTESINSESMPTTHMKKRPIIMTAADHEELRCAVAAAGKLSQRGRAEMRGLEAELERADVVGEDEIPPDLVTMNSRAELLDLETGERMAFTLVLPVDADIEAGKISVLAPLGAAMLGYRVGDEFAWTVPFGIRRLKVTAVHFQPEAALAMAA